LSAAALPKAETVINTDEGRWYGQLGAHFMRLQ
jgi:hypothetical protein